MHEQDSAAQPRPDEPSFGLFVPDGITTAPALVRDEVIALVQQRRDADRAYLSKLMADDWAHVMTDQASTIKKIGDGLLGDPFLPEGSAVFKAFAQPFVDVRVLIVGQDPYPTPGHPIGLSFAVEKTVRPLPASLRNIYAELSADLGITPAQHGDLTSWSRQGVMLLNRTLTVVPGKPASHRGRGWEDVTSAAIRALSKRHLNHGTPLVAILWGRQAQELEPILSGFSVPVIKSAHPSPLSAHAGFFGSRPFSRTNALLVEQGSAPVDWKIE
jgi:uracil-DNA glycosylase